MDLLEFIDFVVGEFKSPSVVFGREFAEIIRRQFSGVKVVTEKSVTVPGEKNIISVNAGVKISKKEGENTTLEIETAGWYLEEGYQKVVLINPETELSAFCRGEILKWINTDLVRAHNRHPGDLAFLQGQQCSCFDSADINGDICKHCGGPYVNH